MYKQTQAEGQTCSYSENLSLDTCLQEDFAAFCVLFVNHLILLEVSVCFCLSAPAP